MQKTVSKAELNPSKLEMISSNVVAIASKFERLFIE